MAAAIITSLAPLAMQVIQAAMAYEQARKAAGNANAPTAAQLAATVEQTDAQIEATADQQLGIAPPTS